MPDNNENNSFLSAALTVAPLAVGAGVGIQDIIQRTQLSPKKSAIEHMRNVAADVRTNQVDISTHINFMNSQFAGGKNANVAVAAWKEAVSKVDPITRRQLMDFTGSISEMNDQDAISAITRTMQNNKSLLMRNIYSKFMRNVNVLSEQQRLFPDLPLNMTALKVSEMPYMTKALPPSLSARLTNIADILGATITPTSPYRSLGNFDVFKITLAGMPSGDIAFNLPITYQGMMVEGMTMQTQRIAPKIGLVEGNQIREFTREEFFLRELEKSIVPDIQSGRLATQIEVEKAVSELHTKIFTELESATYLGDKSTAAQQMRAKTRSNLIQLVKESQRVTEGKEGFVPSYKPITGSEYAETLMQHKLYGGVSPTAVSKGIASQADISEYFLFPEAKDWGRRPEAAFREYQLTENALFNLEKLQGRHFAKYQQMQSDEYKKLLQSYNKSKAVSPVLSTTYIDPEKYAALLEEMNMREGHAIMTSEAMQALEFESAQAAKFKSIREDLAQRIGQGEFLVKKGEVLGTNMVGDIVTAENNMMISMRQGKSKAEGDSIIATMRDVWQVRHGDKFHEGQKTTMLEVDSMKMKSAINSISNNNNFTNNIQMFASMENLKKDRQLYRRQLVTSLGANLANDNEIQKLIKAASIASREAQLDDVDFTRKMMQYALATGFDEKQFGAAFGASSYVLGEDVTEQMLNQVLSKSKVQYQGAYKAATLEGLATGGARLAFDSPPSLKGAGKALGSLEARIFESLRDSHWGQLGASVSDEIVQRMIATNPDKYAVHQALGKTLTSISSGLNVPVGANVFAGSDYTAKGFQQWLENLDVEGGWIKQGKGLRDVFVPSPSIVNQMRPYTTPAGTETRGDLANIYHRIARNASRMELDVGAISASEARKNLQRYTEELAYQWAPAGKGMGGYQRGALGGSRYLRAMAANRAGQTMTDMQTAGITQSAFDEMMQELIEQKGDNAELAAIRERFAKGGKVGGLMARHPTIGPFSMQQTYFQKIAGDKSQIILPEQTLRNVELESGDVIKKITLGPAVGMAADYDADQVAAFLVSPENEKAIFNNLSQPGNAYTNAYNQHQIRYQLLKAGKAKGAAEGMSIAQKMAADIQKIGTTQTWVPQLSTEMTRARSALGRFGKGQAAEDAKMLLEWLEQTPISAKHLSAKDVAGGGLERMMNRIQYSLRNKDVRGLSSVIQQIVEKDKLASEFLTKDVKLSQQSAADLSRTLGTKVDSTLKGVNVQPAVGEIMRSLTEAGNDEETRILTGRAGRIRFDKLASLINSSKSGGFKTVSQAATSAVNMAAAIGKGIIRNKKPLAWGFAGSLAIASMLSSPKDTIGPGNALNTGLKANMSPGKGADRMSPENIMPPSPSVGNPSVPNSLHQQSVRIGSSTSSHRARVRANVGSGVNSTEISKRIANMTNRSTSINIRDDRQSLNPHRIANKLL